MFFRLAFFMLWFTAHSFSMALYKGRIINRPSRKIFTGRSSSFHDLDKATALAMQAATRKKFQNAPALIGGLGTSRGYSISPSQQNACNRASDDAINMTLLRSHFNSSVVSSPNISSLLRIAAAGTLGCVDKAVNVSLVDDTEDGDDFEYYGPFLFGSQAQSLKIDLDTGSADLWVPVNCSCGRINSFQAAASTSYHDTGEKFEVTYGSGYVSGTLVQDTVGLGSFKVYNQSFGAVTQVSESFAQSPSDGLAGLAFSVIADSGMQTIFENLVSAQLLAAPVFSFYMTRTQPGGSEVCFGGIDPSKVKGGNVSWVPVVSKTYWTVNMTGIMVKSLVYANLLAIVDTGTSFIYVPDQIAKSIYDQIPGSKLAEDYGPGMYAYPCDAQVEISFVLDATTLPLDPHDMNIGLYTTDPTGSTCVGAIIAAGSIVDSDVIAILGDSFLKSYVSVFDYSHGARVGFLKSINE